MKIVIDKQGGMHYHKPGCKITMPRVNPPHFKYEEIEYNMRGLGVKCIIGRWYSPCPFCFGHLKMRERK